MTKVAAILTVCLAAVLALSGVFENEAMYGKIHGDAQGYYGYLIATFLEGSFDWEQVIHSYSDVYFNGNGADFTVTGDFGRVNKYYVGTAILIAPFFLLSCFATYLLGFPVDGYSAPFQIGVVIAALFYMGMGIYFLIRFMKDRGLAQWLAIFASFLCVFATPLFHYTISEPAMSHVYSFGLFSLFLFLLGTWLKEPGRKGTLQSAALVFGLIVLVRPANGIIILSVPFVAGGVLPLIDRLKAEQGIIKKLILSLIMVIATLSLQSIMYLLQVGKPVIWSYQGEGFNFLDPEAVNFLFSYKKGLLVYTPFALLGLSGMCWMAVRKPQNGGWLLGFIGVAVYVLSSWWNWYYGGSFGMRAMVEFMPFFAFGAGYLLQNMSKPLRLATAMASILFVVVNLIQSYQYQKFILHWDGMNKERFWTVFLKTNRKYDGIFYREETQPEVVTEEKILHRSVFRSDMENLDGWGMQGINTEKAISGQHSTKVDAASPFGSTLGVSVKDLGPNGKKMLKITAQVWSETLEPEISIAYSYRGSEGDYAHEYLNIGEQVQEPGKWNRIELIVPLKVPNDTLDNWIIYPHNTSDQSVYLDDIQYEVLTLEEN